MGSKFCNLNVYGADLAAVEPLCPNHTVRLITQNWITIVGEALEWDMTQKEAKRLSKALPCHVLSTEYFDDDYVEFALYRSGKRVARHIPAEYEGFARSPGKSKIWAEELGLSPDAEKALRTVFKETNPEVSLQLLECVLGCPLWGDTESITFAAGPTQAYLDEYLARKAAESKIRNQTRLVLLDEVAGDFGWRTTYPVVRAEPQKPVKSFWDIKDGVLRKLFEKAIPGRPEDRPQDWGKNVSLVAFWQLGRTKDNHTTYVFSGEGEILEAFHESEFGLRPVAFLDWERIFLEGACWNIQTHQKEWDLEIGRAAYGIRPPCRLNTGRLAIVYDTMEEPMNSYLVSFQPDGSGKKALELAEFHHWAYPVAHQNTLLLACGNILTGYDPFLEPLWSVDLGENVGQLGEPFLDDKANMLYTSNYRRVTAFDLEKRQVKAIREIADSETCFLHDVLPGVGPIMLTGEASIQVWNSELTPISRHRTKGGIGKIVHQDGTVYILTNAAEETTLEKTDHGLETVVVKPGCLRLYELKL